MDGVDAADADKERIVCQEAGGVALQWSLREEGPPAGGISGDMNPGIAAGPIRQAPAGEPAVFAVRFICVVQPYFESLDQSVLVSDGNQEPPWARLWSTRRSMYGNPASQTAHGRRLGEAPRGASGSGLSPAYCGTGSPGYAPWKSPGPAGYLCAAQERQMLQHIRIGGMALLQRKRLPLRISRLRLLWKRVGLDLPGLLPKSLFVAHSLDSGVQGNAVPAGPAEAAAVLVRICVEVEVVFPRPVVAAKGAAGLDIQTIERPGV